MEPVEVLDEKILELERELRGYRTAREAIIVAKAKSGDASRRFYKWAPIDAARVILKERGCLPEGDLTALLLAGGITIDRKRGIHNVRLGLKLGEKQGSIRRVDGRVCLPTEESDVVEIVTG